MTVPESTPYPSVWMDPALVDFNAVDRLVQMDLDHELSILEWSPRPDDVEEIKAGDDSALAVRRGDYWIIYEVSEAERTLYVWRFLPA